MSVIYRGKQIEEMSRAELEAAIIFLLDLNRKLAAAAEPRQPVSRVSSTFDQLQV